MNQAPAARVPTSAETIAVERHKKNFRDLHGVFEDKDSDNIEQSDNYQTGHMIPSREMAQIMTHNILGEPHRKVRRMLDIPGDAYPNADHWCEQQCQEEVVYQPYQPYVAAQAAIVDHDHPERNQDAVGEHPSSVERFSENVD